MKLRKLILLIAAIAALVVPATATQALAAPRASSVPTVVGIRAAHHPTYDRVVFDFSGGAPASATIGYVDRLVGSSGLAVPVAGRAILQVRFATAQAHVDGRSTAPTRIAFPLPNVMTVVRGVDMDGVVTYGIGLAVRQTPHIFKLSSPDRVVVDVPASFSTVSKRVYFMNSRRFTNNTEPYYTSVSRPVLPFTPATGVMDRLFAGPLPGEQASGLRFLNSGATGFKNLSIADGVARVQLTGGCSSGGSTVSIAGEIFPTLRQFPSVNWVKIYDPNGHTEVPSGHSDSIPECLEP